MQNAISAEGYSFTVANKQRPFGNNFVQNKAIVKQYNGKDEVCALVTCTADSIEPGRMYSCIFTTKGKLIACQTVN